MVVALLAALALQSAQATTSPRQDETAVQDIIVNGRPLQDLVGDFVSELSQPARGRGLAKWNDRICVGVVNLPVAYAQPLVDRISDVAGELGLTPGEPGCTPRVVIVFTADGKRLASGLVESQRRGFDLGNHQTDAGSAALRAFETSDAPVRWWHTSLPVDSSNGELAVRLPGMLDASGEPGAPVINVFAASRLNTTIRDDMSRVVIIVDVEKLEGTTFPQLMDYVTLLSLAQIDPDADTANYDTIMNLFHPGAPEGLTDWDMGYLRALYSTHPERINANALTRSVVNDVVRDRRAAARAEDGPQ